MGEEEKAPETPEQDAAPEASAAPEAGGGKVGDKSWTVALILAILLPGIDRIYLGYTGLGIVKFFTLGGCYIWAVIDFISIVTGKMKDADGNELIKN